MGSVHILLHETAHAISESSDLSIDFEECLTDLLGKVYSNSLKKINASSNVPLQLSRNSIQVNSSNPLPTTNRSENLNKKNFPHGIHIFLSFLLAGLWIPAWFLIYQARDKNIYK